MQRPHSTCLDFRDLENQAKERVVALRAAEVLSSRPPLQSYGGTGATQRLLLGSCKSPQLGI